MKQRTMNLIPRTLENLAKLLRLLLNVNVELKHLRNGKFDATKDDTVAVLWTLLNKFAGNNDCNIVNKTKLYFHSLQYKSLRFYCLPSDMSEGSRQLLLALGFLINKGVLHKHIEETVYKQPEIKMCKNSTPYYYLDTKRGNDYLLEMHSAQWIKGKLKFNERIIEESKMVIQKFVQELNNGVSKSMGNLCAYELLALGNKSYSEDFSYEIENKIVILQCYEKFIRMGRIFWDWMNTIREVERNNSHAPSYEELQMFCRLLDKKTRNKKFSVAPNK